MTAPTPTPNGPAAALSRAYRLTRGAILGATLLALGSGCRSAPAARPAPPAGLLVLVVSPPGGLLLLDDRPILARPDATRLSLEVPAGAHRVELRAPGYFTAYRDVTVPPRALGEQRLDVALRPDPDAEPETATPARPLGTLPSRFPDVP